MRLILGGLTVCLLLVTPSNGDRTEDGGREKMFSGPGGPADNPSQDPEVSKPLPCCRQPIRKPCRFCTGFVSFSKHPDYSELAPLTEMKTTDLERRDVKSRRVTKRHLQNNSRPRPCCRSGNRKNCKVCVGSHSFSVKSKNT